MRVLTVTNMYPTESRPGYGIFVENHVRALRSLGVQVDVFFSDPTEGRSAYLRGLPRLARMLAGRGYDLAHAHHSYSVFQLRAVLAAGRSHPPLLLTLHEGEALLGPGERDPGADLLKRLIYQRWPKLLAARMSNALVSVTRDLPSAIGYRGPFDTVPPAPDLDAFRPLDRRECRKAVGVHDDVDVVFFPGGPDRSFNKGYDLFQEAIRIGSRNRPLRVLLGGEIQPRDMPTYMNASDVVVQTSRFEASPMVIKEALACNRPVVSTDVGDVRRLFGGTPGLFLCEQEPASVARSIGEGLGSGSSEGRTRLMDLDLTLDAVAKRYVAIYERLVGACA